MSEAGIASVESVAGAVEPVPESCRSMNRCAAGMCDLSLWVRQPPNTPVCLLLHPGGLCQCPESHGPGAQQDICKGIISESGSFLVGDIAKINPTLESSTSRSEAGLVTLAFSVLGAA